VRERPEQQTGDSAELAADEAVSAVPQDQLSHAERETKIVNGIEFFRVRERDGGFYEDCQCARCGSSCIFLDCDNCGGEGEIEDEDWQCEGEYYRCDWCRGAGGWWRCMSGADWCKANPIKGREDQPVMGMERDN